METPRARHASEEDLRDLASGRGSPQARRHQAACATCQEGSGTYRWLAGAAAPAVACPDSLGLVRLADLAPAERRRSPLGAHLARCSSCTLELDGLHRLRRRFSRLPVARLRSRRPIPLLARLRALVAFDMPVQVALNPRGARRPAMSAEQRLGMGSYRRRRYAEASAALARARRLGDRAPGLSLYLGASLLRLGRSAAAIPVLEQAVEERRGGDESRWYLAHALLHRGRGDEALRVLASVARRRGPLREPARALAGRVRAVLAGTSE